MTEAGHGEAGAHDPGLDIDDDEDGADAAYEAGRGAAGGATRRRAALPDLRFEHSYLASVAGAASYWRVAYITMRDQVRASAGGGRGTRS
jgi:hypothetical protein